MRRLKQKLRDSIGPFTVTSALDHPVITSQHRRVTLEHELSVLSYEKKNTLVKVYCTERQKHRWQLAFGLRGIPSHARAALDALSDSIIAERLASKRKRRSR